MATNNQAGYEVLLAGLRISTILGADEIYIFSDSQVVLNQVKGEYQAKEDTMIAYLAIAKRMLLCFRNFKITQIPQEENEKVDALSKLVTASTRIYPKSVLVTYLA